MALDYYFIVGFIDIYDPVPFIQIQKYIYFYTIATL